MKVRNATNGEIREAVRKTWDTSRGKADLIRNMNTWIKAVKLILDPLKCSEHRIEPEIDQLVLKKQEKIIDRIEWRERSDGDQSILDATARIWH